MLLACRWRGVGFWLPVGRLAKWVRRGLSVLLACRWRGVGFWLPGDHYKYDRLSVCVFIDSKLFCFD